MSALQLKADMCGATRDVRFGPKADIDRYSITSSAISSKSRLIVRPSALAVFRFIASSNFSWLLYRQFGRLCSFEDFVQINGSRPGKIGQVYSI